jgi:two-component system, sensor histidine kinase and response regulator
MKFWLGWLVVGCIVPAALVAAFLIVQSYQRERASLERDMIATARALMQAVDADIGGFHSTLRVLAASKHLQTGDLRAFYDELQVLMKGGQVASNIILHAPDGQQLINTLRPFEAKLPKETDLRMIRNAIETGGPVVSDLFRGPATGRMVLGTSNPVYVDGELRYLVGMGVFSERLGSVIRRQKIPEGWVVSILDRTGTIGAITEGPENLVGTKADSDLLEQAIGTDEGVYTLLGADGEPLLGGFSRSPGTGWMIAMAAPLSEVTTGLHRALLLNLVLAVVLLTIGVFSAKAVLGRVNRSLAALAGPALALGSGKRIAVPEVEIAEVNELGRALAKARELIEARERERDEAERSERRMERLKQSADDANRAKSEFLTLMSHELRTPMNAILGFAGLLQKAHFGALSDKQKEFADQILASGTYLLTLINDILDLSKIEAGKMSVTLESVDVESMMRSLVATLEPAAAMAGIAVLPHDFGAGMPAMRADRVRLAQVLINLGTNAIKYNGAGGSVRLTYAHRDRHVRIAIADNGAGIPQERQAELFKLFNRLGAENRAIEGTGIGLALSKRLIELMGGTIGFTSSPDEGSCFWIDVPVERAASDSDRMLAAAT